MTEASEQRAARRAAGLCVDCSDESEPNATRCARHLAMHAARVRRSHQRRHPGPPAKVGRPRSITPTQSARWPALYAEGLSARSIARLEGVGFGAVLEKLRDAGVRLRPAGRPRRWSSREIAATARQVGVKRAAEAHGCSLSRVYKARREVGTAPRRRRP